MSRIRNLAQKAQWLQYEPNGIADPRSAESDDALIEALVANVDIKPESRLACHTEPLGAAADRYRLIRIRLLEFAKRVSLKKLLVTSPLPGDGKSTTAVNLASIMSEHGKRRVLVLEGDLRHPTLVGQLGLSPWPGFAECLERGAAPMSFIRRLEPLGWYLLPAGEASANSGDLLQEDALAGVMAQLDGHFDWIIIDSPPVVPLSDSVSLMKHADGALLVVKAGQTGREMVEKAIALLGKQHVLGIVLNGIEKMNPVYSKYGHYGRDEKRP